MIAKYISPITLPAALRYTSNTFGGSFSRTNLMDSFSLAEASRTNRRTFLAVVSFNTGHTSLHAYIPEDT